MRFLKNRKICRIIVLFLIFTSIFSLLVVGAFAENGEAQSDPVTPAVCTCTDPQGSHDSLCPFYVPTDVIFFDLRAGNVTITETTYSGFRYDNNGTRQTISGSHISGQQYYVYQSKSGQTDTGIYDKDGDGILDLVLPVYAPVIYQDTLWGDYITNHPSKSDKGAYSDQDVTQAWKDATANSDRSATPNFIKVTTANTKNAVNFKCM